MKFFLAFLAIFAAASAQDDCELCKMGVDALGKYLSTEAEIAAVEEGRMIFLKVTEFAKTYFYIALKSSFQVQTKFHLTTLWKPPQKIKPTRFHKIEKTKLVR